MIITSVLLINAMVLVIIGITMLLPVSIAIYYAEYSVLPAFFIPFLVCVIIGVIIFISLHKSHIKLTTRSGFVSVALCWVSASIIGALPFMISGTIPSFTNAFFESVSGFTTTGATILSQVENLPRSINLWRAQMHWLGGMGIVALTVALLPLLGVGGFQLIKAETTGPEKGRITPKITVTAKILWFIYLALTILQTILLMVAGMDFTDALSHTFATVGTGGFSSRNSSIGAYNSVAVDWICTIFMILSGINFSLYFKVIQRKWNEITENTELKVYLVIILIASIAVTISITPLYGSFLNAMRYAFFQISSIITTTGFATADYTKWPPFAQVMIFTMMLIGACSGSTGGGVKVIRWVILSKQMKNETRRMMHPHGVFAIQLNSRAGRKDVVFSVAGFFYGYMLLTIITTIVSTLNNVDVFSSFTAALSLVGNIGPGFGRVGPVENFGFYGALSKWWFSFAMIAGRLELYTIFVMFSSSFWKK